MNQFRVVKVIKQESEAVARSSMNILPLGENACKLIFITECGEKLESGFVIPENIALVDLFGVDLEIAKSGNVYLKTQIDKMFSELTVLGTWDFAQPDLQVVDMTAKL